MTSHITGHIPEKHQSVMPNRNIWLGLLGVAVVIIVIAVAMFLATAGKSDCPSNDVTKGGQPPNATQCH